MIGAFPVSVSSEPSNNPNQRDHPGEACDKGEPKTIIKNQTGERYADQHYDAGVERAKVVGRADCLRDHKVIIDARKDVIVINFNSAMRALPDPKHNCLAAGVTVAKRSDRWIKKVVIT